ncbi:MAG: divalent-cation tolerance protein CutA [Acidobacteriota bacterium]|nr:divalent-cation tolerance protein CutA [Acidobacteriota bacterium]
MTEDTLTWLRRVQYLAGEMKAIVVVTTVGTEDEANRLAREIVVRRHAACVNIVPVLRSVYRWQGKVCEDSEYLLVIKSAAEEYPAIEVAIRELHSYELPEILSFKVSDGEPGFLRWIGECVAKDGFDEEHEAG